MTEKCSTGTVCTCTSLNQRNFGGTNTATPSQAKEKLSIDVYRYLTKKRRETHIWKHRHYSENNCTLKLHPCAEKLKQALRRAKNQACFRI